MPESWLHAEMRLAIKPHREVSVPNAFRGDYKLVTELLWACKFSKNDGPGHTPGCKPLAPASKRGPGFGADSTTDKKNAVTLLAEGGIDPLTRI